MENVILKSIVKFLPELEVDAGVGDDVVEDATDGCSSGVRADHAVGKNEFSMPH